MEIISDTVENNGMSCVISTLTAGTNIDRFTEDINEFPFAFITPDCTQDHSNRHTAVF